MLLIHFANTPLIFAPVLSYISWNRLPGATCSSKKKPCHPSGNIPGLVVPLTALYLFSQSRLSDSPTLKRQLVLTAVVVKVNCITSILNSHKVCDLLQTDKLHNSLYFESESRRMFTPCQLIIMCSFKYCNSAWFWSSSNSLVFHPATMFSLKVKCLWLSIQQQSSYCGLPLVVTYHRLHNSATVRPPGSHYLLLQQWACQWPPSPILKYIHSAFTKLHTSWTHTHTHNPEQCLAGFKKYHMAE